ncbi:DUF4129 domain-containing protein [Mycobacterium sp.]|jgi:hypothetical protein|uniref:DUF4129 domain-containing protein n=1 Tax=Mycobacterium sp. TaxID=1785 RepID=UPI002D43DDFB|nr:DUF4129 domain-containing protein [Mycobacterium sp.]HZA09225.1 DUF4129 domain-containing protein [Mycobacterium sp.]
MAVIDKSTGRVAAPIVLLVVAAAALRGYLPGREHSPREHATSNPAATFFVVALLSVSVAVVAIAIIVRLRARGAVAAGVAGRSEWFRTGGARPTWRSLLIGLGVLIVWLLILMLLSRFGPQHGIDQPTSATGASTPTPHDGTAPPEPPARPGEGDTLFGYLAATTVIFLLLVVAGAVIASRRQRRLARTPVIADDRAEPAGSDPEPHPLARAAELGLAEIGDLSREPRQAIIACYAAMEHALEDVPDAAPRDFDTPTEVLARAVDHHALHADSATQLVDLFAEARFSPHVMNEHHRESAVRALELVLAELRSVA